MFICPSCKKTLPVKSVHEIRNHLNHHKSYLTLDFPIKCCQNLCLTKTTTLDSFVRHFKCCHFNDFTAVDEDDRDGLFVENFLEITETQQANENLIEENQMFQAEADNYQAEADGNNSETVKEHLSSTEIFDKLQSIIRDRTLDILIDLRGRGNVPFSVSLDVVAFINSLVTILIDETCLAISVELLQENSHDEIGEKVTKIKESLSSLKTVFSSLHTEYRVKNFYESHPRFIIPTSITVGNEFETRMVDADGTTPKLEIVPKMLTAQYVSIKKTLYNLVAFDPQLAKLVSQKPVLTSGTYDCFASGSRVSCLPTFADGEVIYIQIFYDGLGITNCGNVGGGQKHNAGMYYLTILNLPSRYNACLSNIHLIAMCSSSDLKNTSVKEALHGKMVSELKELHQKGFEVENGEEKQKYYVLLAQLTGDNLGMHQISGLIESFSSDYCCMLCYATREEMQTRSHESDFELRTREQYEVDLSMLEEGRTTGSNHYRGIKAPTVFNELGYFHIIDNWVNDLMHTIAQGIVPYVGSLVMQTVFQLEPKITLNDFNFEMANLFDSFTVEKHNKPYPLKCLLGSGDGFSPVQSAAQNIALVRYLPLVLSEFIESDEARKHLELLLLLQEILDIVLAPRLQDALLDNFSTLIVDFIAKFKSLYPNSSIKPKMHFLVHYPTIIKKNGPMKGYWCMNYERLNGAVKVPSHIMKSYKSPLGTLAYRRQCASLHLLLERRNSRDFISYPSQTSDISIHAISSVENFQTFYEDFEFEYLHTCDSVVVNGTNYRSGSVVVLGSSDHGYLFGKIDFIICENKDEPIFMTTLFETLNFDLGSYCYIVKPITPKQGRLSKVDYFVDPLPLDLIYRRNRWLIRLRHQILLKVDDEMHI